eukprot:gene9663-9822_t
MTHFISPLPSCHYLAPGILVWLVATLADYADPKATCGPSLGCLMTAVDQRLAHAAAAGPLVFVRQLLHCLTSKGSRCHLADVLLPGLIGILLEQRARKAWVRRQREQQQPRQLSATIRPLASFNIAAQLAANRPLYVSRLSSEVISVKLQGSPAAAPPDPLDVQQQLALALQPSVTLPPAGSDTSSAASSTNSQSRSPVRFVSDYMAFPGCWQIVFRVAAGCATCASAAPAPVESDMSQPDQGQQQKQGGTAALATSGWQLSDHQLNLLPEAAGPQAELVVPSRVVHGLLAAGHSYLRVVVAQQPQGCLQLDQTWDLLRGSASTDILQAQPGSATEMRSGQGCEQHLADPAARAAADGGSSALVAVSDMRLPLLMARRLTDKCSAESLVQGVHEVSGAAAVQALSVLVLAGSCDSSPRMSSAMSSGGSSSQGVGPAAQEPQPDEVRNQLDDLWRGVFDNVMTFVDELGMTEADVLQVRDFVTACTFLLVTAYMLLRLMLFDGWSKWLQLLPDVIKLAFAGLTALPYLVLWFASACCQQQRQVILPEPV